MIVLSSATIRAAGEFWPVSPLFGGKSRLESISLFATPRLLRKLQKRGRRSWIPRIRWPRKKLAMGKDGDDVDLGFDQTAFTLFPNRRAECWLVPTDDGVVEVVLGPGLGPVTGRIQLIHRMEIRVTIFNEAHILTYLEDNDEMGD